MRYLPLLKSNHVGSELQGQLYKRNWQMNKVLKFVSVLGCLISVLAPLVGVLLYPRATWLFAFIVIGVAVLVLNHMLAKDPAPTVLADQIEQFLNGQTWGWGVDDFEGQSIKDQTLKSCWRRSFEIGGDPEDWVRLDEGKKEELREIVRKLRSHVS